MSYRSREKREFIKGAVLAMLVNLHNMPFKKSQRDLVNHAGELWDEIVHQTKEADED